MNPFTLMFAFFASIAKFLKMFDDIADSGIAATSTLKQYAEHQSALTQLELDDELEKAKEALSEASRAKLESKLASTTFAQ